MDDPLRHLESTSDAANDFAYSLELWDACAAHPVRLLAQSHSSAVAFACYYAAFRVYFDDLIVLRYGDRIVASTRAIADQV